MQLLLRRPYHAADAREERASWPVVLFVMLVSGFVSYEVCTEWATARAAFLWVPEHGATLLGLRADNGWAKGLWMLFLYPLALWSLLSIVTRLLGGAGSLPEAAQRLALPLVVVVAAGHMAKGLAKFTSWGAFLPHALAEPGGNVTSLMITNGSLEAPGRWLAMPWVSAIGVLLVAAAAYIAMREARLANPSTAGRLAVPTLALAGCFGLIVFGWGFAA